MAAVVSSRKLPIFVENDSKNPLEWDNTKSIFESSNLRKITLDSEALSADDARKNRSATAGTILTNLQMTQVQKGVKYFLALLASVIVCILLM